MKINVCSLSLIFVFAYFVSAQPTSEPVSDDQLILAVTTRSWPGENYPPVPPLSIEVWLGIQGELRKTEVRRAYEKLIASKRNVEWFEGIALLEKQKAVWSLLSCLVHPSDDVQIYALRSMERIEDKKAVPFILVYAEEMAVLEGGSENATIHGVIHETIAKTMSRITGIKVVIDGQDPATLKNGIDLWRAWHEKRLRKMKK